MLVSAEGNVRAAEFVAQIRSLEIGYPVLRFHVRADPLVRIPGGSFSCAYGNAERIAILTASTAIETMFFAPGPA